MKTKYVTDGQATGPSNLYEAMGYKKSLGNYKTEDPAEYEKELRCMNLADLQAHCVEVGIRPNSDRRHLVDRLKKEHKTATSSYRGALRGKRKEVDPDKREAGLDVMRGVNSL